MNTTHYEMAASTAALGTIGAFVGGLVIAGALVWAVRLGIRVRRREPGPPRTREPGPPRTREHPELPESGPVHETRQMREPDEVPRASDESQPLTPYELHASGSRRADNQQRRRWSRGSSGSFGGGGSGRT
ncbi:DUF6479 family protein [Streptomyces sp. NPDC058467]|uniref:DUF6479 family protein n=1 Tax=Streptomyces sp. NPDC058467 TaxID=3346513 RepID=UPI003662E46C